MRLPEKHAPKEFENLLPLVNVVFLLLIFFMVAGAFSTPNPFKFEPTIAENETVTEATTLTLVMSGEGELALDNEIITSEQAILIIQQKLQENSLQKVQLKPDAHANALDVLSLLERLAVTELDAIHILTSAPSS